MYSSTAQVIERRSPALDFVSNSCDIEARVRMVPPAARVRGVWFKILEKQLKARGKLGEYSEYFPERNEKGLRFYWVGDFLLRAAVAGALVTSPSRLHDGMFEIAHSNATEFSGSLFGRTLLRFLARDPVRLTHQAIASTRISSSYSKWEADFPDPNVINLRFVTEYVWIESYFMGAVQGAFDGMLVNPSFNIVQQEKFTAEIQIRHDGKS